MDKHMIHIDDLVRQRLDGGQEPERPGAWLTMRALLDKEMPAAVVAGTNRRRIIGYFTGLLLLATASVGGYKLYNDRNAAGGSVAGGGNGAAYPVVKNTAFALNTANNNDDAGAGAVDPSVNTVENTSGATSHSSVASTTNNSASHSFTKPVENNRLSRHNNGTQGLASTASTSKKTLKSSGTNTPAKPDNVADNVAGASFNRNESGANHSSVNADAGMQTTGDRMSVAGAPSARMFASSAGTTVRGRRTASNAGRIKSAGARFMPAASSSVSGMQKATTLAVPAPVRYVHDTIQMIALITRRVYDASTQRAIFRIDTLPKGVMIVARVVPQPEVAKAGEPSRSEKNRSSHRRKRASDNNASLASASSKTQTQETAAILPAAKQPGTAQSDLTAATDNANLVSLSKFKVSSKHFSLWNAEKIDAAINKFKFNLAKIQMYPGLIAGINGSVFTPNSLGGFQVGLTSLFALNDWWSVMAELKYLYRFNTGSTVRDDYMNVKPGSGTIDVTTIDNVPYDRYIWQEEHVDHYFNYEVVRTFELPLALRYNSGRFYTQGGLNFVYSAKIDAAEVTRAQGDFTSRNRLVPATHNPDPSFISNDHPLVKISDFGARFGTGYVLGAGFMFTPAVYLDFRVSQTFWDNANTSGATRISKDLLRTPSIQLSVGYRFSQQHKP